ncbi:MAG: amidohydrolase [Candidatus Baltobacteraceae bacterium]
MHGSESSAQSAEFASWLWAGGPRTVLVASLVADTDHGWYAWDVADVPLSSKNARGFYSPPVIVRFPQPLAIRHAWVTRVQTSGDARFDGTTDGQIDCDAPNYPGPLPEATPTPKKAASLPHFVQTVSAVQVTAPVAVGDRDDLLVSGCVLPERQRVLSLPRRFPAMMQTANGAPVEELQRYRRHFHAHPELSMEERETAAFIEGELRAAGFDEIRSRIGKTGILATLKGGRPGPVTLLRADMDALPVQELNQVVYRSVNDGVMHACGHDGHMAILLAAARGLRERRAEIPGTIVFCFQPGEEGHAGNKLMIEDGALEDPHVDRTFALHLYSGLEVGRIGVRDGAFFASSDRFDIELIGKGGHGAMPQMAIDPVVAAAQLVAMLQTIPSREIAAKDPVVLTVGSLHSGTTFNVIPERAYLQGTARAFDDAVRRSLPERVERMVAGLADAMRLEYRFEYRFVYPPTVNDHAANERVREVGRSLFGRDHVVDPHDIVMWSEDMSFMQEQRPGAYFLVGARGEQIGAEPQHSAYFDIDERALRVGYEMMLGLALSG